MGAQDFYVTVKGETARQAFRTAVEAALHEYGHGGYTGTIAEKNEFKMIDVPAGKDPVEYRDELMRSDTHWVQDKWGPAGCIKKADGEFMFFGTASS